VPRGRRSRRCSLTVDRVLAADVDRPDAARNHRDVAERRVPVQAIRVKELHATVQGRRILLRHQSLSFLRQRCAATFARRIFGGPIAREEGKHMLRGLTTMNLWAEDLPTATRGYAELLGVEPYFMSEAAGRGPGYVEFRIDDYQHELASSTGGSPRPSSPSNREA
jgi:hypothetical protein